MKRLKEWLNKLPKWIQAPLLIFGSLLIAAIICITPYLIMEYFGFGKIDWAKERRKYDAKHKIEHDIDSLSHSLSTLQRLNLNQTSAVLSLSESNRKLENKVSQLQSVVYSRISVEERQGKAISKTVDSLTKAQNEIYFSPDDSLIIKWLRP